MKKFILCTFVSVSLILLNAQAASSVAPPNPTNTQTVYGPKAFTAALGQGKTYNDTFKAQSNVDGVITVINGSGNDLYAVTCSGSILKKLACELENVAKKLEVSLFRAKTVRISLNGQVVLPVNTLNPAAGKIQISIRTLNGTPVAAVQNSLKVEIVGAIASSIKVEVKAQTGQVNQLPIARLAANPSLGVAPLIVNFSGLLSSDVDGSIASYDWNFGDPSSGAANTASGSLAMHSFLVAGNYTVTLLVRDNQGASATVTQVIRVAPNTLPVAKFAATPVTGHAPLPVAFSAAESTDAEGPISTYTWNFGDGTTGAGSEINHTFADAGQYNVVLTVTDEKGASATAQTTISVLPPNIAPRALIRLSRSSGISPLMVELDGSGSTDSDGTIAEYKWEFGDGTTGTGTRISHEFGTGTYNVTLKVKDNHGGENSITAKIVGSDPVLPVKPELAAPELSSTTITTPGEMTKFLYAGDNPIQVGVVEGTIDERFASVIRGRVLQEDGSPLSGAIVTILSQPQYGQTTTREDGYYDLAVNGGGSLIISIERNGYYGSQRKVSSSHQSFATVDDIVMLRPDAKVTVVTTNSDVPQIAKGTTSIDTEGARTAIVMIPSQTSVSLKMADGSLRSVPQLSIRTKEYTVGPNGPNRMPAELPASSAYTYAVQLTADEVAANGATGVEFSKPVAFYVDNFLGFSPGDVMPVGIYDTKLGRWVPSENGRVMKVISIENTKAVLNVTGDGPASSADLASLGIDEEELKTLALSYQAGATLWRARLNHFSIIDLNAFNTDIENLDIPADIPKSRAGTNVTPTNKCGSIIEVDTRTLGESVEISGTPFSLFYTTSRAPGRIENNSIDIPITEGSYGLSGVDLKVVVAGNEFNQSFGPAENQRKLYTWNGLDAFGRKMNSSQIADISITYKTQATYLIPDSKNYTVDGIFALMGLNLRVTNIPGRNTVSVIRKFSLPIGPTDVIPNQGVAGWSLDVHHAYDPVGQMLYLGNGAKRNAQDLPRVLKTVVGTGIAGFSGDGDLATKARMTLPGDITTGNDNSIYFRDTLNFRIRKVDSNGIISTIAGNGRFGNSSDGSAAATSSIGANGGIALSTDGEKAIYFSEYELHRIKRISSNGLLQNIAGTGVRGFSGDGGPAGQAQLNSPTEIKLKDGSIYFNDSLNNRIRVIKPNGIIQTVAGNGANAFSGDGGPAIEASISQPIGLTIGPNGDLFVTDTNNGRVRRIDRAGTITTVAGGGTSEVEGASALDAKLTSPTRVVFDSDGTMYIACPEMHMIKKVGANGRITTFAGTGQPGPKSVEGEVIGQVNLNTPFFIEMGPDRSLYVGQENKIQKLAKIWGGLTQENIIISSEDGSEIYTFDKKGKHLETRHSLTMGLKDKFLYDSGGRLISIVDGDGNATSILRDSAGRPVRITGPFGHQTNLEVGDNGYLATITNPNGESHTMTYSNGGLLASFTNPRGSTSRFTYDAGGQLVRDQDAAGGFKDFSSIVNLGQYTVQYSTAEGRSYSLSNEAYEGNLTLVIAESSEGRTRSYFDENGGEIHLYPTHNVETKQSVDPRRGGAFRQSSTSVSMGLKTYTTQIKKSVTYQNNDPNIFLETNTVFENGRQSVNTFSSQDLAWTNTTPEGRVSKVVMDAQNRPLKVQSAGLSDQDITYNSKGLVSNISQGGRSVNFVYDEKGRLASRVDALGRITKFGYDNSDRMIETTLPDGRTIYTSYDANGNITGVTPSGRSRHTMDFNIVDMLISYLPPTLGAQKIQYTYNLDKDPTSIQSPDGTFASFVYSPSSKRLAQILTNSGNYLFSFDFGNGLVRQMTSPSLVTTDLQYEGYLISRASNSGQAFGTMSFSRNNDFRVTSSVVNDTSQIVHTYSNDGDLLTVGPVTQIFNPATGLLSGTQVGTVKSDYFYSLFGELSSSSMKVSDVSFYDNSYVRDSLGRITSRAEIINGDTSNFNYTYDQSGRLIDVLRDGIGTHYEFDSNGNRLSVSKNGQVTTAIYNDQDQLLSYGNLSYAYKPSGNLFSKTQNGLTTKYDFDIFGNLKSVELPNSRVITYVNDAMNRRVGKVIDGVRSKFWVYESQIRIAAELDGLGQLISRFVYGDGHSPVAMIRNGITYKIVTDHLGSVRLVINSVTGEIAQRIEYDEYGHILSDTNPGFQPFGFAGGLYDLDTNLVRFGARDYDSETGRWTSKDPLLFDGGDSNLYSYVGSDPINRIDLLGTDWTDTVQGGMEFLVGIGDAASFGLTSFARDLQGPSAAVNKCSKAYKAGGYVALGASMARLAYAGVAKIGALLAKDAKAANAFRNIIKLQFRGGDASKTKTYQMLLNEGKNAADIKKSAGKTNLGYNSWYTGMGAKAAKGICECP
jgi:RHS repeat-associated protein